MKETNKDGLTGRSQGRKKDIMQYDKEEEERKKREREREGGEGKRKRNSSVVHLFSPLTLLDLADIILL